ncbi:MAG: Fe-S cluster assembly protein SufB, partial [Flavobacteriales bacterium]|nr:Fe-S cluster assembly protein SufB [Flavobacteriales bacterium]
MGQDTILDDVTSSEYKYGFETKVDTDIIPPGLNEDVIRTISKKKKEPEWMTQWRLDAYAVFMTLEEPDWANVNYPKLDLQSISYYAAPKKVQINSLDEVDPELLVTFEKLGISLDEQKRLTGVAMDIVVDSVSVATTFKKTLNEKGILFCSMSEA